MMRRHRPLTGPRNRVATLETSSWLLVRAADAWASKFREMNGTGSFRGGVASAQLLHTEAATSKTGSNIAPIWWPTLHINYNILQYSVKQLYSAQLLTNGARHVRCVSIAYRRRCTAVPQEPQLRLREYLGRNVPRHHHMLQMQIMPPKKSHTETRTMFIPVSMDAPKEAQLRVPRRHLRHVRKGNKNYRNSPSSPLPSV
jgi:hypothetical protein